MKTRAGSFAGSFAGLFPGSFIAMTAILVGCATEPQTNAELPSGAAADDFARRGHAFAEAGQPDAALRDLNQALRLDPQHVQATYDRASVHYSASRFQQALADIDRAVLLDPQNARPRNARCVIQVAAERNGAGLKNCHYAMLMQGPVAETQTALGQALLLLSRPREALVAFDNALKAEPGHAPARYGRGIARQLTGDADGRTDVQEAMRLSPTVNRRFDSASAP